MKSSADVVKYRFAGSESVSQKILREPSMKPQDYFQTYWGSEYIQMQTAFSFVMLVSWQETDLWWVSLALIWKIDFRATCSIPVLLPHNLFSLCRRFSSVKMSDRFRCKVLMGISTIKAPRRMFWSCLATFAATDRKLEAAWLRNSACTPVFKTTNQLYDFWLSEVFQGLNIKRLWFDKTLVLPLMDYN